MTFTHYNAMRFEGKEEQLFEHRYKMLILKNLDDKRFLPVVMELIQEEIKKYEAKAQKCYVLGEEKEAIKCEETSFLYSKMNDFFQTKNKN